MGPEVLKTGSVSRKGYFPSHTPTAEVSKHSDIEHSDRGNHTRGRCRRARVGSHGRLYGHRHTHPTSHIHTAFSYHTRALCVYHGHHIASCAYFIRTCLRTHKPTYRMCTWVCSHAYTTIHTYVIILSVRVHAHMGIFSWTHSFFL